jgi:hypothetical protein
MLNLFAFRATDPSEMKKALDPVGPDNDKHLLAEAKAAERVIACWGDHGVFLNRDNHVCALLRGAGIQLECLIKNKNRTPHHPLYLAPDIQTVPFP